MKVMPPAVYVDMDSEDEDSLTDDQRRILQLERRVVHSAEYYPPEKVPLDQ